MTDTFKFEDQRELFNEKEWGLYDTKDNCWIGNFDGPCTFPDEMLAQIAALMVDKQLKNPAGRTRAVVYDGSATQLKDTQETCMGPEQALQDLEEGRY